MSDTSIAKHKKDSTRLVASYMLSLSLFALAGSIAYFTFEMASVSKQIPDILARVDSTTEKLGPVVADIDEIINLVPDILKEVEEVRATIPPILHEVEQTRKQIPLVLKESEAIRGELPAVLVSLDRASDAVTDASEQIEATRPLIPEILKEVETTRESIPPMMDRADVLIEKAQHAGKEAGKGAATGFFSGLFMAPFALVGDAGRSVSGMSEDEAENYTDKDFELNQEAVLVLLNKGSIGDEQKWENAESGNQGIVLLKNIYPKGEDAALHCRTLIAKFYKHGDFFKETPRSFCMNEEGKWALEE